MAKGKMVVAKGIHNPVFKDLKTPLEVLAQHPDIQAVNASKSSVRGGGSYRGLKIGPYNSTFHTLKITGYTQNGAQEFLVVTPEEAAERVKKYVEGLNQKYF